MKTIQQKLGGWAHAIVRACGLALGTSVLSLGAHAFEPTVPLDFSLQFLDASDQEITTANVNEAVTVLYTLENPNRTSATFEFDHYLAAGRSIATPSNVSSTCPNSTLVPGPNYLQVDASINGASSCTIRIDIVSTIPGSFTTSTNSIDGSLGSGASAQGTINFVAPPQFSMVFNPSSTTNNDSAQVTYTINNVKNPNPATGLNFSHNFNAGLEVYQTPNASTTCVGGTLFANAGAGSISYVGGSVPASSSCTINLLVGSEEAGTFIETTGDLSSGFGNSGTASGTLTVTDVIAPRIRTIERANPSSGSTDADILTWRIRFTEAMDIATFTADQFVLTALGGGLTADLTIVNADATQVEVRASGGNLPDFNGLVTLGLNSPSSIADLAGNVLVSFNPTEMRQDTFELINDSTPPMVTAFERYTPLEENTNADELVFKITFSEPVQNVGPDSFQVTGTSATGTDLRTFGGGEDINRDKIGQAMQVQEMGGKMGFEGRGLSGQTFLLTVSGGDLATYNGVVGLDLALGGGQINGRADPPAPIVVIRRISDYAGNGLLSGEPATDETYTVDNRGPELASITRLTPNSEVTDADTLTWDFQFSRISPLFAIEPSAFTLTGTTATLSVERYSIGFYVTASGGDLADLNGPVTIALSAGSVDEFGNALTSGEPTGANENSYTLKQAPTDTEGPDVSIASTSTGPVSGAFPVTFTFTEDVTGFVAEDVTLGNATLANFAPTDAKVYTADVTPSADGAVTIDIAANVATDAAENGNDAAPQFTIVADASPPGLSIELPGAETTGAFTATFTFTEDVTGFELADILLGNAAASDFAATSGSVYTARITPSAPGTVSVSVAAAAGKDAAGNDSLEASVSLEAVSEIPEVVIDLSSDIADPEQAASVATISNPGSAPLPFTVQVDVPWITVTPLSGTISPLGTFDLSVSLNDAVNSLDPGDYLGTVTVTVGDAPVALASMGGANGQPVQSGGNGGAVGVGLSAGTILVELPVNVAVQERFGNVQLVATTQEGPSGEASFTYASDVPAFDNLTLSTSNNRASASSGDILFGSYDITQMAPPGWRVKAFNCSGDLDGATLYDAATDTATVDVDPGESIVCVFENVRDEDAVRLATQRAIRNFMLRRADRIIDAAPELSRRFSDRDSAQRGGMSANASGAGYYQMDFSVSLSGARNAVVADEANTGARFNNSEASFLDGWDVWLAAEASGIRDDRADERSRTDFATVQLGVDYLLRDDVIIGAMAQYDWMEDEAREVFSDAGAVRGAQVQGEGWMAGPYAVWRVKDSLVVDGLAMFGESDNRVNPLGLYSDDFETERYMVRANVTGEIRSGPWTVRPQAGITQYKETQSAYTDTLGIKIPAQDISLGRFRAGPEVAWRNEFRDGSWLQLSGRLNAVWDYDSADLLTERGFLSTDDTDLRADARIGVATQTKWGPQVRLEVGIAGVGAGDFRAETARIEIRVPFGSGGLGQGVQALASAAGGMGLGGRCDVPGGGVHSSFASQSGCSASMQRY
ncbi:Ig-like domain-containing protein [Henriciella marina]|uniref:Ig-like domain-containing protein n=1 Tax=Henriciella marina TaxID=453851 RepID=A0ABT4LQ46_9PROT|nr:Ig-like domain-containing protein [Henriciella marina]MCZ4296487.1 Ig-like domain-containing protein [Henriciella marina]